MSSPFQAPAFWPSPLRFAEPRRACSLQAGRGKTSFLRPSPAPGDPKLTRKSKPLGPSVFPAVERWPSLALLEAASSQGPWGSCSAPAGGVRPPEPAPALPPGGSARPAGATPHHAPARSSAQPPPPRGHPSPPAGWRAGGAQPGAVHLRPGFLHLGPERGECAGSSAGVRLGRGWGGVSGSRDDSIGRGLGGREETLRLWQGRLPDIPGAENSKSSPWHKGLWGA